MKLGTRMAFATTSAALTMAAMAGSALAAESPAVAAAQTFARGTAECGTSYSYCMSLRRTYIKNGYRLGPLNYGYPGCVAPDGCENENWFYYYW